MTFTDKAKTMADTALEWVGEHSGQVGEKVAEVAEQVREGAPGYVDRAAEMVREKAPGYAERAAGLADRVRDKAPAYVDRMADLAGRAADATATGVDRATGGRFHDPIDKAHGKVEETLDRRARPATDAAAPGPADSDPAAG